MNVKTIAWVGLAVSGVVCTIAKVVSNKHARKKASEEAQELMIENEAPEVVEARKGLDIYNKLTRREYNTINREINKWKQSNGYNTRKSQLYNSKNSLLEEFKDSIEYSNKVDEIKDEYEALIDAFKESINYDDKKEELEKAIEEAKDAFDKADDFLDSADGKYTSDLIADLRHDAEKSRNKVVKESEDKLKELEKQLKTETAKYDKQKQDKLNELETMVAKEKVRISQNVDKQIKELEETYNKASKDITNDIYNRRTDEEIASINKHDSNLNIIKKQEEVNRQMVTDIYGNWDVTDKLAIFFKEKKYPKFIVGLIGSLPIICVGALVYKYAQSLFLILKKMECEY